MGARLRNDIVWAEMARRKIQFHADEKWQNIRLWGLFSWGSVSHLILSGALLTTYKKENKTIWVTPTKETYEKYIQPLLSVELTELTRLAGWYV